MEAPQPQAAAPAPAPEPAPDPASASAPAQNLDDFMPDMSELTRLSQTYGVEMPQTGEADGGIPFGGGADNAFVRDFAERPQYERTLEEIERDERRAAAGYVDPVRRERLRNEFRARSANGVHIDPSANADWRIHGMETSRYAQQPGMGYPNGYPDYGSQYVQPLSDEPDYVQSGQQAAPVAPASAPAIPPSSLARFISQSTGFSVFTIITAGINLLWSIIYMITGTARGMEFSSAERAMALQGQMNYTLTFQSPMLGPLKFFMYLLPLLAVAWAITFKVTDSKGFGYNRKTIIAFLCLVAFSMVITVIDIATMHLIG